MTQYTTKRRASNSKARLEGNPQTKMKPQAKPIESADDVSLTEEEQRTLFAGMLGCIGLLLFIIAILSLILIFGS